MMKDEPIALKKLHTITFGAKDINEKNLMFPPVHITDEYYWLRENPKKNNDVAKYLTKENRFTRKHMFNTKKLQQMLCNEILSKKETEETTHPFSQGDGGIDSPYKYFYMEKEDDTFCFQRIEGTKIKTLLDTSMMTKFHIFENIQVSPNHKFLSYGINKTGNEQFNIYFKDIDSDQTTQLVIKKLLYAEYNWAPDSKSIYFSKADKNNRVYQLCKYDLSSGQINAKYSKSNESLIFEETDPHFNIYFSISNNGFLLIRSTDHVNNKCYYAQINTVEPIRLILVPEYAKNVGCTIFIHENNVIMLSSINGANNFKLTFARHQTETLENTNKFADLRKYDDNEIIRHLACFKEYIAIILKKNNFLKVVVLKYFSDTYIDWDFVEFNEPCVITFESNDVYDTKKCLFTYSSPIQPEILYEYDMENKLLKILKQDNILGYDSKKYILQQIMIPSNSDNIGNVLIPVTLISKKSDLGPKPCCLCGYGAYGEYFDQTFDESIFSLIDRGFIYAIAHVRGGGELGGQWHNDGKMFNKMNTFYDFISVAEYLVKNKYADKLAVMGESAGGLLASAVLTMRPDLFKTVIADRPFVDVLNTMADITIPLVAEELNEWGNPHIKKDFEYIKKYSPYDNIEKKNYPDTLFITGLNDARVGFWEAVKFTAKLRSLRTDKNLHLLKIERNRGHYNNGNINAINAISYKFAFILKSFKLDHLIEII